MFVSSGSVSSFLLISVDSSLNKPHLSCEDILSTISSGFSKI